MIIALRKANSLKKQKVRHFLFNYVLELRLLTSTNRTFQNAPNRDNVVAQLSKNHFPLSQKHPSALFEKAVATPRGIN